jgi:hypothetical protein
MTYPFLRELAAYVGRIRQFQRTDWLVYLAWVGLVAGLALASGGFLLIGRHAGGRFPAEAYLLPAGAAVFAVAVAVDTIGHRTIYKQALLGAETLVHHVTIFAGVGSCVLLCLAYPHRGGFAIPALVLTALSFIYSLVDEALHWRRYLRGSADRVETWSHVLILIGHGTMMLGWWRWYALGYAGVREALTGLGL